MFAVTTNPSEATGDGVAMAMRAGVGVADLEFFQFHPTALAVEKMPRPLLTEALRGHGAHLLDRDGKRFVNELLPRDVVSRAILAKINEEGSDHVWLDCRMLDHFKDRFANIFDCLVALDLDPATDLLPVAPAAHHQCGGIVTDIRGATTLPGLWAAGETACSGVHGANRLASNSLLEGLVFGPRAVQSVATLLGAADGVTNDGPDATGAMRAHLGNPPGGVGIGGRTVAGAVIARPLGDADTMPGGCDDPDVDRLQRAMTRDAGVLRDGESLERAAAVVREVDGSITGLTRAAAELRNLATGAMGLIAAAQTREETRGCHARSDFPTTNDARRFRLLFGVSGVEAPGGDHE